MKFHQEHFLVFTNNLRFVVNFCSFSEFFAVKRQSLSHSKAPLVLNLPTQIQINFTNQQSIAISWKRWGSRTIWSSKIRRPIEWSKTFMRWLAIRWSEFIRECFGSNAVYLLNFYLFVVILESEQKSYRNGEVRVCDRRISSFNSPKRFW